MSQLEEFVYDPFSPEVMSDPLPFYKVMRDHFPVYYSEKYDAFYLSRFEDAWEFLGSTDNTFIANEGTVMLPEVLARHNSGPVPELPTEPLGFHLNYGSPVYEQIRQAHGRPLRPGAVRKLEGLIRTIARERLDLLLPRGHFDLTQEYGGIVSASVICHLLRFPLELAPELLNTVNLTTRRVGDNPSEDQAAMSARLVGFALEAVSRRRAEGTDGSWPLLDGMIDLEFEGRRLDDPEIAINMLCVVVGGTETLPKVVAHGLLELARHPRQLAEVRQDLSDNCAVAFEEINRFCGPAQWFGRTARRDTTIAGQSVRAGQRVFYLTQSAMRDEREFDSPDEFRWDRPIPRTLSFGRGQHFCIGVHVARLEGRILLEEFLRRVDDYEIDESAAVRLPSSFQWGYNELPVRIRRLA